MLHKMLTSLLAVASVTAAVAVPAGANVPSGGQGLEDFGQIECEGGLGTVTVFGPFNGPVGFTTTGTQLVARSLSGSFTDEAGNVIEFSKTFGNKTGYGTFYTCRQTFEGGSLTLSVAVIPPES
jgi:hypothetical protein